MSDMDNPLDDPVSGGRQSDERGTKHLDEMVCLLYIERQLDRARAQEVSAHTQECNECRTLLRAMERESRLLTRAMLEEDEALPARLAHFQERARRSMQWIWGVAFGLAATGVYALYADYIEPWQDQLATGGVWKHQLAESADFSRCVLEGVAIGDHSAGGGGDAHDRWLRPGFLPAAVAARIDGAGAGADGVLRGGSVDDAAGSVSARCPER